MGAPTVAGVRVNRFGQLMMTDVERPLGGGLEVLGRMLRCDALSVTSVQLTDWVQVWVNEDKLGTEDLNPVLTGMVRELGGSVRVGGAGVFLATRPGTFTLCGLDTVQVDAVRQAWTVASV